MQHSRKALLAVAGCALLWSTGGIFIKLVDWHPFAIAGTRSLISAIVLLVWLRRPKFSFSPPQIAAALCNAMTMIIFVNANKLTTAANAILLQYSAPIFVAIIGWAVLKEKPSWDNWVALAAVCGGMILFFLDKLSAGSGLGNLLAILSGVTFALFSIFMRMQKSGSPLESIVISHLLTFLISIPFIAGAGLPGAGWPALIALGVFQVGLSSILFSYGIKHTRAITAMLIAVLEPILNPLWVFIFVGEQPGFWALVGGAIIVAAVTVSSVISVRRSDAQVEIGSGEGGVGTVT
jgi:drug/metabolite transporter (DMT)-like permease